MWKVVRLSMISEGMERIYRPTREVTDVVVQSCISLYFTSCQWIHFPYPLWVTGLEEPFSSLKSNSLD